MAGKAVVLNGGIYPRGFSASTKWRWPLVKSQELVVLNYGKALRAGDRLDGHVPVYGTNGQCGWHDSSLASGPGVILGRKGQGPLGVEWCNSGYWVIDTAYFVTKKTDDLDLRYFYYLVKYVGLNHLKDGTSNPSLSRDTFADLLLPLPPLSEQKAIAEILGALDAKIELNRRMNRTLESLARSLFKSWFVDFDPVRAKMDGREPPGLSPATAALFPNSFEHQNGELLPTGWESRALYDTATFINGAAFRSEHFCDPSDGLPVVKIAELKSGITRQTKFSDRTDLDSKYNIDTGALLYSWSGSPDTSLDTFLWTLGPGLLNQHIFKIETNSEAQKHFVYYLLKYLRPTLIEIARNKQTTGLGHVTVADMRRLGTCFPPAQILQAFDVRVGPVFDKCFLDSQESQTLAALRDTLLPRLLSGELRIGKGEE